MKPSSQSLENEAITVTYDTSSEPHSVIETSRGAPSVTGETDRVALLERAIERLTRAMGTVDDVDIADLARERAAMRGELEGLTRDRNVVVLRPKPR